MGTFGTAALRIREGGSENKSRDPRAFLLQHFSGRLWWACRAGCRSQGQMPSPHFQRALDRRCPCEDNSRVSAITLSLSLWSDYLSGTVILLCTLTNGQARGCWQIVADPGGAGR